MLNEGWRGADPAAGVEPLQNGGGGAEPGAAAGGGAPRSSPGGGGQHSRAARRQVVSAPARSAARLTGAFPAGDTLPLQHVREAHGGGGPAASPSSSAGTALWRLQGFAGERPPDHSK
jgi:hypothetical protein